MQSQSILGTLGTLGVYLGMGQSSYLFSSGYPIYPSNFFQSGVQPAQAYIATHNRVMSYNGEADDLVDKREELRHDLFPGS